MHKTFTDIIIGGTAGVLVAHNHEILAASLLILYIITIFLRTFKTKKHKEATHEETTD